MKSLYDEPELHKELGGLMWLFESCTLETRCEAVVEGIVGSIVNVHANGRRRGPHRTHDRDGGLH